MTELLFLHSARRPMFVDTCIKILEYSLGRFQVIERKFQGNSKSINDRVTVLALCTSTHVG